MAPSSRIGLHVVSLSSDFGRYMFARYTLEPGLPKVTLTVGTAAIVPLCVLNSPYDCQSQNSSIDTFHLFFSHCSSHCYKSDIP